MGMKKKMLSATLCAVMVGSLAAPAFTVSLLVNVGSYRATGTGDSGSS